MDRVARVEKTKPEATSAMIGICGGVPDRGSRIEGAHREGRRGARGSGTDDPPRASSRTPLWLLRAPSPRGACDRGEGGGRRAQDHGSGSGEGSAAPSAVPPRSAHRGTSAEVRSRRRTRDGEETRVARGADGAHRERREHAAQAVGERPGPGPIAARGLRRTGCPGGGGAKGAGSGWLPKVQHRPAAPTASVPSGSTRTSPPRAPGRTEPRRIRCDQKGVRHPLVNSPTPRTVPPAACLGSPGGAGGTRAASTTEQKVSDTLRPGGVCLTPSARLLRGRNARGAPVSDGGRCRAPPEGLPCTRSLLASR